MWSFCGRLTCRVPKGLINASRLATVTSTVNVEIEMKRLNETKHFSQALTLFDELRAHQIPRDQAVVQALKACTQLKDLQRGLNIHQKLTNRSKKNNYIQSALIHFYS